MWRVRQTTLIMISLVALCLVVCVGITLRRGIKLRDPVFRDGEAARRLLALKRSDRFSSNSTMNATENAGGNQSQLTEIITIQPDVTSRLIQRQTFVRKACLLKQRPSPSPKEMEYVFHNLIVDDKHHFIYCVVPKTGVTSWKSTLLVLMGKAKSVDQVKHANVRSRYKYLDAYPAGQERQWRLNNYTKIMVHRDPLMRLISGYNEKFSIPDLNRPYHAIHGRRIISLYRPGANSESLQSGTDVKFEEFVKYVLAGHLDAHWVPASTRCQPCYIDYDYYAATETADTDSVSILRAIGAPQSLRLPHSNEHSKPMNITQYFSLLSRQTVERLLKLYEDDFLLFGYDVPDVGSLTAWSD